MNPTQQKYSIYDQEILALVTALDKWSHSLRVAKVTAHTDHQALTHLQQLQASKPLRGCTTRWLDFLAQFPDLQITYVQGARNQVADALSRLPGLSNTCSQDTLTTPFMLVVEQTRAAPRSRGRPANYRELAGIRSRRSRQRTLPSTLSTPPPEPNPEAEHPTPATKTRADPPEAPEWPHAYSNCPVFRAPYEVAVKQPGDAIQIEFRNRHVTFRYVPSYLHNCIHGLRRMCVPQFPEFLMHILHSHQDHVTAGHRAQKKTLTALRKHYYWPGMRAYSTVYVYPVLTVVRLSLRARNLQAFSNNYSFLLHRWAHVSLDFITNLPLTTTGHDSILVMVDSLSKVAHFVPAKKSFTAADTVELLADRLIRYHGFPEVVISDRDSRFQSNLWQQLCHRSAKSSSYHAQSDGQTERVNRTLEQMLRTYIQSDEREWERLLPALELAYNTTSYSSTELSLYHTAFSAASTMLQCPQLGCSKKYSQLLTHRSRALATTLTPPMTKLFRQLCDRAQSHIQKAKWEQKYYADKKRRAVEYAVGDKLVPHLPGPPDLVPQEADTVWPPIRDAAGNPTEEYDVVYIMDRRGSGADAQYLVKWRGTTEDQATWEPANHLTGCQALLRAWHCRQRRRLQDRKNLAPSEA
ncbi:hypothetical protein ENH_00016470 [Eimeria necatrix]|uniref:Uncharacterized protein n=1 Tax=Eimeria necatrix TaxID=51315 RepID=U6MHD3_9EIME|nr:hypothetical protein ENH_00016470 [Eimeria necatrix]CDJ62483.1 hypothetical protein ENH_00016470 [Eimeria necatrix]